MSTVVAIPTKSGLPPKEHNFCHYLVADPEMNPIEAWLKIKPELKRNTAKVAAYRVLAKDEAREYIGKLLEERQKRLEMDEDWVMLRLRDIHDRCIQAEPVYGAGSEIMDEDGNPTGEHEPVYYKFDAAGATKSLELIGKHMKMFSDKTAAGNTSVSIHIDLGNNAEGEKKPVIEGEFKRVGAN